jgi:hypothetical protein
MHTMQQTNTTFHEWMNSTGIHTVMMMNNLRHGRPIEYDKLNWQEQATRQTKAKWEETT